MLNDKIGFTTLWIDFVYNEIHARSWWWVPVPVSSCIDVFCLFFSFVHCTMEFHGLTVTSIWVVYFYLYFLFVLSCGCRWNCKQRFLYAIFASCYIKWLWIILSNYERMNAAHDPLDELNELPTAFNSIQIQVVQLWIDF